MTDKYIPPQISEIGLEDYLDDTRSRHNDYGYSEFIKMHNTGVNKSNLAHLMNVSRGTIIRWLKLHKPEVSRGRRTKAKQT